MRYQALKHHTIKLAAKANTTIDAKEGVVLVPQEGAKIFVHWMNENGKLVNTYTLTYPTRIEGQVKLINGLDKETTVQIIEL